MLAIGYRRYGGPDVLERLSLPIPAPGLDEALLRHTAISVNFSDVNARRGGVYPGEAPRSVTVPGNEAVGEIVALGAAVEGYDIGDKVAYAGMGGAFFENSGAYAAFRAVPARRLLRLPADADDIEIAAILMKGLTASAAINRFHRPAEGETVLVHAAASGVGLVLCQWAKHLGARVLGTVGSRDKARVAADYGCDEPILYRTTDFVAAARTLCPEGLAAVYDGVGKDTAIPSLDCLRPFGKLVNYGNASGPPPAIDLMLLSAKGSLSVGRVGLGDHIRTRENFEAAGQELLSLYRNGVVRAYIKAAMPLEDAAEAHRLLESGTGAGAIVLVP
jgi:NADPH2:quinone reductase